MIIDWLGKYYENDAIVITNPFIITGGGGGITLSINDISHTNSLDSFSLTQLHNLLVNDISHVNGLDGVSLTQVHSLLINDITHSNNLDGISLTQLHNLIIQEINHTNTLDGLSITVDAINLIISKITHANQLDNAALTQVHNLLINDINHLNSLDVLQLLQVHNLLIDDIFHLQSLLNVIIDASNLSVPIISLKGTTLKIIEITGSVNPKNWRFKVESVLIKGKRIGVQLEGERKDINL